MIFVQRCPLCGTGLDDGTYLDLSEMAERDRFLPLFRRIEELERHVEALEAERERSVVESLPRLVESAAACVRVEHLAAGIMTARFDDESFIDLMRRSM